MSKTETVTTPDFSALKATLVTRSLFRTYLPNNNVIEVAVSDSDQVQYVAEIDMHGRFVAMRDDHPFAKEFRKILSPPTHPERTSAASRPSGNDLAKRRSDGLCAL